MTLLLPLGHISFSVTIYKAWIVEKSFRQVQGVDYDKIFSLVAMLKSVWIMLAIATFYEIWQMDVKTAFLNGSLTEELYMMQPKLLSILKVLTKCASSSDLSMDWCKPLGVGIYALINMIKAYGFIQTFGEACIYKKVSGSSLAFLNTICRWHIVVWKWYRISG